MVLSMVVLLGIAVLITQLVFSLFAKKLWIKVLPVVLALGLDAICWGLYFCGTFSEVYGGDFAAFIYGIVLPLVAAMAGIAWGIYGIVKLVQKRQNKFVM